MPAYDSAAFRPAAPVAFVTVRSSTNGASATDVPMLIDSGSDVSLLPRDFIVGLIGAVQESAHYEIEGFDGTKSVAPAVQVEIEFLGKLFRGQFLIIDGRMGIMGRNVLNSIRLSLDGPALTWSEVKRKR